VREECRRQGEMRGEERERREGEDRRGREMDGWME
jgi:hypothetical protein